MVGEGNNLVFGYLCDRIISALADRIVRRNLLSSLILVPIVPEAFDRR